MRSFAYCLSQAHCVQNAEIAEKGALLLISLIAGVVLLICVGVILYQFYKLFILLSDFIGYWVLKSWRRFK